MQAPLLLSRRAGQEEEQVIQATQVHCPEKLVMDTGVVVDALSRESQSYKGSSFSPAAQLD